MFPQIVKTIPTDKGGILLCCLLIGLGYAGLAGSHEFSSKVRSAPLIHGDSSEGEVAAFAPSIQALTVTKDGVVYAGSFGMGVFRSDDRGQNWQAVNVGLSDLFLLCLEEGQDGRIYAGTVRGGVFRTLKDGTGWERINKGMKRVEVKSLLASARGIFAGTGGGVYVWDDSEARWNVLASELDQLLIPSLVMLDDETLLVATAGKGLFGFDIQNSRLYPWGKTSLGLLDPKERLTHRFFRVVTVNHKGHIFLGTQDGGLFRSTDHGVSWHPLSRTLPNDSIRGVVAYQAGLFVATGRGIFKLSKQERRWNPVNTGLTELAIQTLIVSRQGVLYAGTSAGAFRSDNGGGQWVDVSEGFGLQISPSGPYQ